MQGDFTRWTFDPGQGYRSVLLQQGRVLLDADFNEQTEITAYHDEARTRDIVGPGGGPSDGAGFSIVDTAGAPPAGTAWADLRIAPGSYYVDGILCEAAVPAAVDGAVPAGWPLADQPHLRMIEDDPGLPEPQEDGRYFLYLDAWTHHVTADEEPSLREAALGGPDTTTRARTVWQVRIAPIGADQHCPALHALAAAERQAGTMVASLQEQAPDADPCQITASGGYQRLENQLYRVQIHDASGAVPTFTWSRENASVVAALTAIEPSRTPGLDADLLVDRVGRDEELSISLGNTVEVTSTDLELRGLPGFLATAGAPDDLRLPVSWTAGFPASLASLGHSPIVRRWEAPPGDAVAGPVDLEGGIRVGFPGGGSYATGDYWLIPARAVRLAYGLAALPGTIEWPAGADGAPLPQPPQGPVHQMSPLAILVRAPSASGHAWSLESDCRKLFSPLTDQVVMDLLGGDGQLAVPGQPVPAPIRVAVRNGALPVADALVQALDPAQQGLVAQARDGEATPPTLTGTGATSAARARTGADGVAAFVWEPDFTSGPSQRLGIALGEGTGAPIIVSAQPAAGPDGPIGPRVSAVRTAPDGTPLPNGGGTAPANLAAGLRAVVRGAALDPQAAAPQLMHVSLDVPWPATASEREWAGEAVGYRAVELQGTVSVGPESLLWTPAPAARAFILNGLWGVLGRKTAVTGWIAIEEWALAADPAARDRYLQWFLLSPPAVQPLPSVVGRTRAVAERQLAAAGMAVSVTEEPHPSVRKGLVVSADPAPGTEVSPGTTVNLVVSAGRAG
jgi:uncharacterized protein DUF6519/PASTA domain-containing protein